MNHARRIALEVAQRRRQLVADAVDRATRARQLAEESAGRIRAGCPRGTDERRTVALLGAAGLLRRVS